MKEKRIGNAGTGSRSQVLAIGAWNGVKTILISSEHMDKLIEALQIFLKYGNPLYPTHCEHDVLYICEIDPKVVSEEDKKHLDDLGFFVSGEEDENCFISFRFGSA